jgi:hypothetical protein
METDSESNGSAVGIHDKSESEMTQLIKNESQEMRREIASGKNPKWKQFNRILYLNQKTDFIECIKCKIILTHKKSSGTNVIIYHKCKIDIEKHSKIDDFLTKRVSNVNLNTIKSELTHAIVLCCAIDMRSFNIIEGESSQILAQKLVDIGAQYGSQKVDNILPTPHTISNRLLKTYKLRLKYKLFETTKDIGGIGVTFTAARSSLSQNRSFKLKGGTMQNF